MFVSETDDIGKKINGFIDVREAPYLLGEYIQDDQFIPLPLSEINNGTSISTENRTSVVTIDIDQTYKDEEENIFIKGNNQKTLELEDMITNMRDHLMKHDFGIIRKGLLVRINYRLENAVNGKIIKSVTENFKIYRAGLYSYALPSSVNDIGVINKYSDSVVSTINQFTHGTDGLKLRVNTIKLFYESVIPHPPYCDLYPPHYPYGYPMVDPNIPCHPVNHNYMNNFFHYGSSNKDIFLNETAIDDERKFVLIPCGSVFINKAFNVMPSHRIIFRINVWKNDLTVVPDTSTIASLLNIPAFDSFQSMQNAHDRYIMDELKYNGMKDRYQDKLIEELQDEIRSIKHPDASCGYRRVQIPLRPLCGTDKPDYPKNLFISDIERIIEENM